MSEFDSNRNLFDELYVSLKEYLDLRINEGKLSVTESLAVLFSRLIVFVLAVITGAVAFGFFAFAFSQNSNSKILVNTDRHVTIPIMKL